MCGACKEWPGVAPLADRVSCCETCSCESSRMESPKAGKRPQEGNLLAGLYMLGPELGRGNFGIVYQALNTQHGNIVAVKRIPLNDVQKQEEIQLEIELLKTFTHENIIKYIATISTDDHIYIVLEYAENGSVSDIVEQFGRFPENVASLYVYQLLQGLKYLHEKNLQHRDIKAANILLTKNGSVKVADFGIASPLTGKTQYSSAIKGSPYWMSPEVILGEGAPTTKSDIWSVGSTVIELITGEPPYSEEPPLTAAYKIVECDMRVQIPSTATPDLRDFLNMCFERDTEKRPSAATLLKHPWIWKHNVEQNPSYTTGEVRKTVQEFNTPPRSQLRSRAHSSYRRSILPTINPDGTNNYNNNNNNNNNNNYSDNNNDNNSDNTTNTTANKNSSGNESNNNTESDQNSNISTTGSDMGVLSDTEYLSMLNNLEQLGIFKDDSDAGKEDRNAKRLLVLTPSEEEVFKNTQLQKYEEQQQAHKELMHDISHKDEIDKGIDFTGAKVKIIDTVTKRSGPKVWTEYNIVVTMESRKWLISRRYSQFFELQTKLKKLVAANTLPVLPPKRAFGNLDPLFISQRKWLLDLYLQKLVEIPDVVKTSKELKVFLIDGESRLDVHKALRRYIFVCFGKAEASVECFGLVPSYSVIP